MRRLLAGMLLLTVSAVSHAQTTASDQANVLRAARVLDGVSGSPIDNAIIVIRDGRILAIGPAASVTPPPNSNVIDYTGKTIIPGLISAHSHVGIFAGAKAATENYNRNFILQQLRQYEAYGVTAVTALGLNGPVFYEARGHACGVCRICLGHGLVRPMCQRASIEQGVGRAGRPLDRGR